MELEDRISIDTPEGVTLEVPLAGIGSRFVAELVDQFLQWLVILALLLVLVATVGDTTGGGLLFALFLLGVFVVQFGYHVLFEVTASGRTPGKRWTGLRVVKADGGPVDFASSAVRNLLRIVDMLPTFYLVGIVAIVASRRNQRLGDMAAGTIVVREKTGGRATRGRAWAAPRPVGEPSPEAAAWDVAAVTNEELATVRRFLERRATLTPEARARLAAELAARLRPKVVGPPDGMTPERFLIELAAVKATRG
ncbi:MAG TPA: RDD family protein [Acidimicrobiales bacterium]|nr:RDD family protein [Acidimicrobiales bacterium]